VLNAYLVIKLVHIVSATLLFGTGLGTAFFMFKAHASRNFETIKMTSRHVVLADWMFTLPAVIVQLASGLWLAGYLQIPWSSLWLIVALTLFATVGLCWLPVVWIQLRIRSMTSAVPSEADWPVYRRLMAVWIALGIPAFLLTLALFALMVLKPGL
jgi:uncharacterized membrane protein